MLHYFCKYIYLYEVGRTLGLTLDLDSVFISDVELPMVNHTDADQRTEDCAREKMYLQGQMSLLSDKEVNN